jgi:hypothetical protein
MCIDLKYWYNNNEYFLVSFHQFKFYKEIVDRKKYFEHLILCKESNEVKYLLYLTIFSIIVKIPYRVYFKSGPKFIMSIYNQSNQFNWFCIRYCTEGLKEQVNEDMVNVS